MLKDLKYEVVVIGNTNIGKSTFLNNLTKMPMFFKVANVRETSCIWRCQVVPDDQQSAPYVLRSFNISPQELASIASNKNKMDIYDSKIQLEETSFMTYEDLIAQLQNQMKERRTKYKQAEIESLEPQERERYLLAAAEEKESEGDEEEDDEDFDGLDKLFLEINVSIQESEAVRKGFRVINRHVSIVDIPGIDDGKHWVPIVAYLERFSDRIIPIVLVALNSGGFSHLSQNASLLNTLNNMTSPPIMIYTRL